jgi:antitoxin (DNA-binding transcriptional repressor) of toxin-antitoxin stability system
VASANVHQAKAHPSRPIEQAGRGEEVVIARPGTPVATLVRCSAAATEPRRPGSLRGLITIRDHFDDPRPDAMPEASEGRA